MLTPTTSTPTPTPTPVGTTSGGEISFAQAQAGISARSQAIVDPTKQDPTTNPTGSVPTAPPPVTPIGTPVKPPTGNGTPTPPTGSAPTVADQYNTGLASTLATQQAALQASLKTQQDSYKQQADALTQKNNDLQQLEEMGLSNEGTAVKQESQQKQAALDEYNQQFKQNYDARQKLTDQLQNLLTTGQSAIDSIKNTSGLSSIMNARVSETVASVQGQAGVITASLAAYDSQMGAAKTHLDSAVSAINSIYTDQISYWKNIVDFYSGQGKENNTKIAALNTDQQKYIDAQISTLQDNVKNTQAIAKIVQDAMLDPTKALTFAKAGVSLTDSPAQISQKLATQAQADQNVWGAPKLMGGDYIQTNRLTGETRTVVSNIAGANGPTGTAAERQAAKLQTYSSAFVPGAKLKDGTPIIDNNGFATPTAWKQAIADFPDRAEFIKKYGYLLYTDKGKVSPSYGLTPAEQKLITGALPA